MRILTWNIAALPKKINFFRNPYHKYDNMIHLLHQYQPDIICLQEVFDYQILDKFNDSLKKLGYHTHYSEPEGLISKNGLLNASKNPILQTQEIDYSMYTGVEYLIKKGIISSTIEIDNQPLIFHNSHLQSNSVYTMDHICTEVRQKQKQELLDYLSNDLDQIQVLCGDLNDDFSTQEHQMFLKYLPFKHLTTNSEKLITFPKHQEQLDFIIINQKIKEKYTVIDTYEDKISDHQILMLDINL